MLSRQESSGFCIIAFIGILKSFYPKQKSSAKLSGKHVTKKVWITYTVVCFLMSYYEYNYMHVFIYICRYIHTFKSLKSLFTSQHFAIKKSDFLAIFKAVLIKGSPDFLVTFQRFSLNAYKDVKVDKWRTKNVPSLQNDSQQNISI